MGDDPKKPDAESLAQTHLQATPEPRPSPASSDATRLRPVHSAPNLLEEPPELPLTAVDGEHYDVGDEVARGGLGRILRAYDKRLHRVVAVKLLRARDPHAELRFMREALITARLQHPAIVPVYEAGRWPDGEPFYAMKLLSGKALSDLITERPALDARLKLLPNVIAVADAIAYAHEHRVIHRDLKPANIMVGAHGETLVIDWGLAKDLDAAEEARAPGTSTPLPAVLSAETIAGSVLGTPAYMPPEQARGEKADERADVYALGAVLYHVLTGKIPLEDLSPAEAMHRVLTGPLPDVARVVDGVPDDLAAIVRKAMAFDRAQRYPSAAEVAADLRRFQEGKLVSVRSYFWWERLWRWTQKNRALMSVAAAALAACVAVGLISVSRVIEERNNAVAARQEADRRSDELVLVQAVTALERDPTAALAWLQQHPGGAELAKLRTVASDAVARGVARHVFRAHEQRVSGVAFGASSNELYSTGADGRLIAYDLSAASVKTVVEPPGVLWVLARSADGKTLAASGGGNQVRVVSSGKVRLLETDGSAVLALELSPDATQLAAGTVGGKLWLWDLRSGAQRELEGHSAEIRDLVFSPDGARLASASWDGTVRVHALRGGEAKLFRAHSDEVWSLDFSPDGRLLATGGADGTVRLWDEALAQVKELRGHRGQVTHLQFSRDGVLATASRDRTVRVWAAPYERARVLEGHGGDVSRVQFSPSGQLLASTGADMTVRLWDLAAASVRVLQGHEAWVNSIAFSPDGRWIASGGQDSSVRVWEVAGAGAAVLPQLSQVALSPSGGARAGVAPGGQLAAVDTGGVVRTLEGSGWRFVSFVSEDLVVAVDGNRDVRWWRPGTGEHRTLARLPTDLGGAVLASGSIAAASYDGMVRVWPVEGGAEQVWPAHKTYTLSIAVTPDGKTLASSGEDGMVKLFDVTTGKSRELPGHVGPIHQLRVSRDGALLASGDMSGDARVWRLGTGEVLVSEKQRGFVRTVALSRDGKWVASGGDDKVVRVRSVSGTASFTLSGPEQAILDVDFSPDGELVAVGSGDRTVRVFDFRSGAARVLRGHSAAVRRVQFGDDGSLLSVDGEGMTMRWKRRELEPLPATRQGLRGWIDTVTSVRIDAEHRPTTAAARR